jgi:hypothetical protein
MRVKLGADSSGFPELEQRKPEILSSLEDQFLIPVFSLKLNHSDDLEVPLKRAWASSGHTQTAAQKFNYLRSIKQLPIAPDHTPSAKAPDELDLFGLLIYTDSFQDDVQLLLRDGRSRSSHRSFSLLSVDPDLIFAQAGGYQNILSIVGVLGQ